MVKIQKITVRGNYYAEVEDGLPIRYSGGSTPAEAIGNLIFKNRIFLGLEIEFKPLFPHRDL